MDNEEKQIKADSGNRFRASGRDAVRENVATILGKARHFVVIYSPMLDPVYFNTAPVCDALARLCSGGRPNRVRILVHRGDETVRNNNQICELARRFSDFIQLKQLEQGVGNFSEMFIVADRDSCLRQPDSDKAECLVDLNPGVDVGALSRHFQQLWDRSEPIPSLHVLGLGR